MASMQLHDPSPDFLQGGGEMGALMRAFDWAATPLGPTHAWPQSLRTVIRLLLNTGHPMYVFWGPERTGLYNDAYRQSIGPERHPGSLGRRAFEVWEEIWDVINPQIEQVMAGGGATWHVNQLVPITRNGRLEDVYWTYSYSPIDDEAAPGGIGGVLVLCTETTAQVQAERRLADERNRLAQVFDQAPSFMAALDGPEHRFQMINPAYTTLVGGRQVLGRTVAQALPEAVQQGYVELLDRVYTTGEAYVANAARYVIQDEGEPPVERFVDFVYQPVKDPQGKVSGIFVQGADVTERSAAERSLRESDARFRAALKAGRMGSWETDYGAMTRYWSTEGMELFGLNLPDGRGQVGGPQDEYVAALHPEDRHLAAHFRRLADQQDTFQAEYRIVRPDGTVLWLSGRGQVAQRAPDGRALRLISIMGDATERKRAEDLLHVEHERLEIALSAGSMGAYDMDLRQGVLWWSPHTYALFGVDTASFVPTPERVLDLLHPDEREDFMRLRAQAIAEHRPFVHEFRIVRPDGSEAWLSHRGLAQYDSQGQAVRNYGITMDITERRRAEDRLRDADQKKDRFIAVLAHELRNPLAPIRNAVEVMRRLKPDAPAGRFHDIIDRQVRQMAHLLDDLLDASRLSRGELRLRLQPLLLEQIIGQAVEIAQPHIDAGGHALVLQPAEEPLHISGDLTRLAQVFSNILINAAKYTPRQGAISLACERRGQLAVVTVTDNGVGIEAADTERIFEMFTQLHSDTGLPRGGQGIGLALARGLVELHGGTIAASSGGRGQGSRFEVRLPLMLSRREAATDVFTVTAPERQHRILVVDDLADSADSLAEALRGLGQHVDVAYSGEAALSRVESVRPDIVLLDLGMPGMDGYEVCRRLRGTPAGQQLLIIAQTGWGQKHDRERTHQAGFDHHVVKPMDLGELLALFPRAGA
ncbi:PAS domain-containing protein [Variovorax sp. OV329]|uniref:hybrid sensor histidine kinase/response regulator n=1 Tax=Variovorax sp. OV329 TaxID=1882825 RepID=UPI0008F09CFA|nr:PAS domain-containing protein [Variovorax sp. OV329]SFN46731.1 PAS domain S-box-containing protein [Variovorax sp. OV329]